MKTYLFRAELEHEEDRRSSAQIEALPGCAAWGYSEEEALAALGDAAEAYTEDVIEAEDYQKKARRSACFAGYVVCSFLMLPNSALSVVSHRYRVNGLRNWFGKRARLR